MCMVVLLACKPHAGMPGIQGSQQRVLNTMELKLQTVVATGNWTCRKIASALNH